MDCSTPGLPVHHQLPEFTQIHVHWVSDAIQPSHPLLSPFPPAFNLSQNHGLFKWGSSSHQVAKVLEFQLQHQSFQWIFSTNFRIMACFSRKLWHGFCQINLQIHKPCCWNTGISATRMEKVGTMTFMTVCFSRIWSKFLSENPYFSSEQIVLLEDQFLAAVRACRVLALWK